MNIIEVKPILTDAEINSLEGNFLDESYMKYPVINQDTIVKNENTERNATKTTLRSFSGRRFV